MGNWLDKLLSRENIVSMGDVLRKVSQEANNWRSGERDDVRVYTTNGLSNEPINYNNLKNRVKQIGGFNFRDYNSAGTTKYNAQADLDEMKQMAEYYNKALEKGFPRDINQKREQYNNLKTKSNYYINRGQDVPKEIYAQMAALEGKAYEPYDPSLLAPPTKTNQYDARLKYMYNGDKSLMNKKIATAIAYRKANPDLGLPFNGGTVNEIISSMKTAPINLSFGTKSNIFNPENNTIHIKSNLKFAMPHELGHSVDPKIAMRELMYKQGDYETANSIERERNYALSNPNYDNQDKIGKNYKIMSNEGEAYAIAHELNKALLDKGLVPTTAEEATDMVFGLGKYKGTNYVPKELYNKYFKIYPSLDENTMRQQLINSDWVKYMIKLIPGIVKTKQSNFNMYGIPINQSDIMYS